LIDAGTDRAPEGDREIDGVEHQHRQPTLPPDAGGAESRGEAAGKFMQARVGQAAPRVSKHGARAVALPQMAVHEPVRRIVLAGFGHGVVSLEHAV
jgi:hypothetical protein